jgi:hypothetical protein
MAFLVCGLFLMPSAQVRRGTKITRMPFAEWQKICLDDLCTCCSNKFATGASLEIKKQLCPWSSKVTFRNF